MAGGEGRGGSYKNAAASRFGRSSGQAGKTKRAIAGKMLGIGTYGHLLTEQGARNGVNRPKKGKTVTRSVKSVKSAGSGKKGTTSKSKSKAGSKAYSTGAFSSQKAAKSVGYKSNISSQRR
jgi:hypothetical protein